MKMKIKTNKRPGERKRERDSPEHWTANHRANLLN